MHPSRLNLTVAMPWYEQEDFAELWALAHDRDEMPPRYEDWYAEATRVLEDRLAEGRAIQIVTIRKGPYLDWLAMHGLPNTADSRLRYVEQLAMTAVRPLS